MIHVSHNLKITANLFHIKYYKCKSKGILLNSSLKIAPAWTRLKEIIIQGGCYAPGLKSISDLSCCLYSKLGTTAGLGICQA